MCNLTIVCSELDSPMTSREIRPVNSSCVSDLACNVCQMDLELGHDQLQPVPANSRGQSGANSKDMNVIRMKFQEEK